MYPVHQDHRAVNDPNRSRSPEFYAIHRHLAEETGRKADREQHHRGAGTMIFERKLLLIAVPVVTIAVGILAYTARQRRVR